MRDQQHMLPTARTAQHMLPAARSAHAAAAALPVARVRTCDVHAQAAGRGCRLVRFQRDGGSKLGVGDG